MESQTLKWRCQNGNCLLADFLNNSNLLDFHCGKRATSKKKSNVTKNVWDSTVRRQLSKPQESYRLCSSFIPGVNLTSLWNYLGKKTTLDRLRFHLYVLRKQTAFASLGFCIFNFMNDEVQGVLALCEFHYCEFHYCGFSKLLLKFG